MKFSEIWTTSYSAHGSLSLLVSLVFILAAQRLWSKHKNQKHIIDYKNPDSSNFTFTPLTETEEGMLRKGMPPVSTLTWLQTTGDDLDAAVATLQERLLCIMQKNPWLAGRIVRQKDGHEYLVYCKNGSAKDTRTVMGDAMFVYYDDALGDWMKPTTPPDQIAKELTARGILLQTGKDREQPLWKVIIVPTTTTGVSQQIFAVVVSMSHAVGDGHTYYQLYNALMMGTTTAVANNIPTLNPVRIATTMEQQRDCLGAAEFNFWEMPGFALCMLRGFLLNRLGSLLPFEIGNQWRPQTSYFRVDMDAVQRIKQQYQSQRDDVTATPFISTNDILTSWFFQGSNGYFGRMAINFRNRLPGHTDTHAGNYENNLLYRIPQDTASPALIRQSLTHMKRVVTAAQPPTNRELVTTNISLISNWSSFSDIGAAPSLGHGTNQLLHVPLFDVTSVLPTTVALCIIFSARPGELGVMVTGTRARMAPLLQQKKDGVIQGPLL